MSVHVYVFLLVVCLLLFLTLLWRLCWFPLRPSSSRGRAKRNTLHRLLKPRTPDDCPACRLGSTPSSGAGPAHAPVRPWSEVKSRRGAPKRVNTQGYACPNRNCPYFGNTDAHFHALVGDGKHGRAEPIQTFCCQACRTTFSARRHTPLYRLKTPSQQIAMVLSALAEGLDPSAAERVFGYRQATITTWLTRAGEHAQTLHQHCFRNLQLPHVQLDELRTRLRSNKHVVWLWLAIDPRTKILPVLQLGPRTKHMAHRVIHSLQGLLAPNCLPLFTSDGLNLYFYAALGPFWTLERGGSSRKAWTSLASGGGADLRPGEEKLPTTQVGSGDARDAPWDRGRSQSRLTGIGLLWEVEHGIHRAGESDRPARPLSAGTPHLGDGAAVPTVAGASGVVARVLSRCASPPSTARGARAATRARWQTGETTLPAPDPCDGRGQNEATMDGPRGALVSLGADLRLRGTKAR